MLTKIQIYTYVYTFPKHYAYNLALRIRVDPLEIRSRAYQNTLRTSIRFKAS
jgi:hypothetical protein